MIRIAPAALALLPSPFRALTELFEVSPASAREIIRLRDEGVEEHPYCWPLAAGSILPN
jgi:hypothetical protein